MQLKLPKNVLRGLQEIIPVIDVALESPSCSDFQQCTSKELQDAEAALDWLRNLVSERQEMRRSKISSADHEKTS